MRIKHLVMRDFTKGIFPYIYKNMAEESDVSKYETELSGIVGLKKTLYFAKTKYYRDFYEKSAYLICSLVADHHFNNGNKRLGVMALIGFLMKNSVANYDFKLGEYKEFLKEISSQSQWENKKMLGGKHATFLYNLALLLADSKKWNNRKLDVIRMEITKVFRKLYVR